MSSLLEVRDACVRYPQRGGLFSRTLSYLEAVSDVSFSLEKGEILAIVGESGCGKSTLAQALVGLQPFASGNYFLNGKSVDLKSEKEWKSVRNSVQMIFQDPYSSLNPRQKVLDILSYPLRYRCFSEKECFKKAEEVLEKVGLPLVSLEKYPHEFSGGQRQRLGIARALMTNPEVLVCDEVTSALDVSVQAQVLKLLDTLRTDLNLAIIFISHDMQVVQTLADKVMVMYLGQSLEEGKVGDVVRNPLHPYTQALLQSVPTLEFGHPPEILSGEIVKSSLGCVFAPRCSLAKEICFSQCPNLNGGERKIRCLFVNQDA